ncbi:MAG: hypothetical protein Q7O66_00715 [Dehalococcoidia bacterium]|nr:hypothetical protein [Dehalococcoidia bacterium]
MNVEVWGAEMFESVCPGKAKHRGFDQYLQAYLLAVEIFGIGNVGCNFVAGASLMARNGHSTWQEARDSLIEGFRWLMKSGVFPALIPLRLGAGSVYGDDKSSWEKVPPTSLFLELGMAHHEIMMEYGLYDKLNKLLFCPLDCQDAQYCGDLGMLAIAGDVGHWADSVFPEGTNWLAEFISSVNTNEPR